MSRRPYSAPLLSAVLAISLAAASTAGAQETITPAPDPVVGTAPDGPNGAQETHDSVSIQQLMKLVELSRLIGGGITQLFASIQGQRQLLDLIRGALNGTRTIPLFNSAAEIEERGGGDGLVELANGALNGAVQGPPRLLAALEQFRTTFALDKAFALKDDELLTKRMIAQLGAKGAVAASLAETSYKRGNDSMGRLDTYVEALKASADLKTSMDLNTRVMIELTQQSNESLRTQAAISSIIGAYFMVLANEASDPDWLDNLKNFNR